MPLMHVTSPAQKKGSQTNPTSGRNKRINHNAGCIMKCMHGVGELGFTPEATAGAHAERLVALRGFSSEAVEEALWHEGIWVGEVLWVALHDADGRLHHRAPRHGPPLDRCVGVRVAERQHKRVEAQGFVHASLHACTRPCQAGLRVAQIARLLPSYGGLQRRGPGVTESVPNCQAVKHTRRT